MRRTLFLLALGALVLVGPLLAAAQPAGRVVIAQGVDPTTLDPQNHEETPAYNVLLNLYDTLLFRDKDLKIIPWIAESWRVVNPTTWEFKIRKGVKFHNGEELDADAVKFSLERLINPDLKMRQAPNFTLIDKIEAPDKYTVRVITKKPFPTLENQARPPGRHRAAQVLQGEGRRLPGSQSRRVGALQVRPVGQGRGHHDGGQRVVVGRGAEDQDARVPADPRAHHAGRRAPGRRGGHRHQRAATPREAGRGRCRSSTSPRPRAFARSSSGSTRTSTTRTTSSSARMTARPRTSGCGRPSTTPSMSTR